MTDLIGCMTDEGTQNFTGVQTEKAWFVKKRLEFTVPEEIAKKQLIYDFANHLDALKNTKTNSDTRIKSIKANFDEKNTHIEILFMLREKGFSIVPIRHDKLFESVVLSDRFKSKDIYVISLNYKEHSRDSLLRKVLFCNSKLTFDG